MAVGSFCDSSRAYAIMDLAEGLLALTYGLHPEVDFLSLNGYIPFYLRAFAMIDLNRSICQRRHTFFAFLETPQMGGVGFLNDGSHDQVCLLLILFLKSVLMSTFVSGLASQLALLSVWHH